MRKFRWTLRLLILILLIQLFIFGLSSFTNIEFLKSFGISYASSEQTPSDSTNTNTQPNITTYSKSCILMDSSTGKILYEKNANEVSFPASTTKIMTAILALEKCSLTDVATVSHNAIFSIPPSYSHASLKEGEELTIEQLLNVLMIPSANDAAVVLAEHISGSTEEFANLMNEKAKEIGCLNTHFVNPNGIHDENHTTTAYDLALMGKYAMQNSTFRNIVKKTRYTLPATNQYDKADRIFNTTNELLRENNSTRKDNYYYPYATGIKTGYTTEAGSCIVASASKDGMEVIVVILGGETTKDGLSERFLDCKTLFDYAFENYSVKTVHEKNSVLQQISIKGATSDTKNLNVLVKDEISILLESNKDVADLNPEITFSEDLKAPISENSVIGKITYQVDGTEYSSDLLAETSVIASGFLPILLRILLIFVTLYLLYLLLKPKKKKGKRKSSSKHLSKNKKTSKKKNKKGGHFRDTRFRNL